MNTTLIEQQHQTICHLVLACQCRTPCETCEEGLSAITRYENERADGEPLKAFDSVFGPALLPARDRPQAAYCVACSGLCFLFADQECKVCEGTGYDPPQHGYALFSPDGEMLSDRTDDPAAIVLAAAACHQAANWLGEPVSGGFALIRRPNGQGLSAWACREIYRIKTA